MIDQKLVTTALDKVGTTEFELFSQTFYGGLQDRNFIPLGGIHDGGAEGFTANALSEPGTYVDDGGANYLQVSDFVQVSKQ